MSFSSGLNRAFAPSKNIARAIVLLRGEKVILDADLAVLYGVETGQMDSCGEAQRRALSRRFHISTFANRICRLEVTKWRLKRAVAYIRVSTDEQRLGPEAQRAAIEAWARKEGVRVEAWHEDLGISGGSELDERQGLIRGVGELRAWGAGLLVVAKRDRLARDVAVSVAIEKAVQQSGARVVSAEGVANGDSDPDAFMRHILDAAAAYERALIRTRTKTALAVKKAQGLRVGAIPLGYQLAADGGHLNRANANLQSFARCIACAMRAGRWPRSRTS